ncbi:hypothetical protein PR048_014774 [Dryococelus australis]|uniref:Uncharacterized protein n=1 Tax=Dryococelus australis TaxID=614101 RepID=A0ABQ9HF90_9NEOP|nr:hypothetical protein PR048_014774 [Dryococelus australis]
MKTYHLPPTRFGFNSQRDHSLDFRTWELCWMMQLIVGFSQGFPVSPALSFWWLSILTSLYLIGSQDLDVKSRLNFSMPDTRLKPKRAARCMPAFYCGLCIAVAYSDCKTSPLLHLANRFNINSLVDAEKDPIHRILFPRQTIATLLVHRAHTSVHIVYVSPLPFLQERATEPGHDPPNPLFPKLGGDVVMAESQLVYFVRCGRGPSVSWLNSWPGRLETRFVHHGRLGSVMRLTSIGPSTWSGGHAALQCPANGAFKCKLGSRLGSFDLWLIVYYQFCYDALNLSPHVLEGEGWVPLASCNEMKIKKGQYKGRERERLEYSEKNLSYNFNWMQGQNLTEVCGCVPEILASIRGAVWLALVHDGGDAADQWAIAHVRVPHHPANVGCRPPHIVWAHALSGACGAFAYRAGVCGRLMTAAD